MPWAALDTPSLALGILARRIKDELPELDVDLRYVNIASAEWMAAVVEDCSLSDYNFFSLKSYFMGCGDWVFSSALYDDPGWRVQEFEDQLGQRLSSAERDLCLRLHDLAPEFIDRQAQEVVASGADLVGFTSTFQQNVASLAMAKRLKELNPSIRSVLGGANCDGPQGEALHRSFPAVDYVVRGEGEYAFPELVSRLLRDGDLREVPGLCWRRGETSVANPMTDRLIAPSKMPMPEYQSYFERLEHMSVSTWFEPRLVIEAARGCWWGEKHHCTFCGLNGSAMTFRSKEPATFLHELETLAQTHKVLDFYAVDNILDMGYVNTVLASLAMGPNDFRIQYEIKSNMQFHQLEQLLAAGIVTVQPGIESLNTNVLNLMNKGVNGPQNVRMLRDAESLGLSVAWNYLFGFPQETTAQYVSVISQMPALHHLCAPGGASRIALERFSPFFDRPELGFSDRRPHRQYGLIYDLPDENLADLAFLFETEDQGISKAVADELERAVARWAEQHMKSILNYTDLESSIKLVSSRSAFDWQEHTLTTPVELLLFRELDQPRTPTSLARSLAHAGLLGDDGEDGNGGLDVVTKVLDDWSSLGVVFNDTGRYIHVATHDENQMQCRIQQSPGVDENQEAVDHALA
jgi:magnesium-protoporphyrin IX monomethyl ester (oxidative) cyclase